MPSRALALFLLIGFTDLIVTAVLHYQGLIVEVNPVMRYFINQSEWLFAVVKGLSLLVGWAVLTWYAKTNRVFVRNIALAGSAAYVVLWVALFAVYR